MSIDIDLFPFFLLRFAILHITHVLFSLVLLLFLLVFSPSLLFVLLAHCFLTCSLFLMFLYYCSFTFTTLFWVSFSHYLFLNCSYSGHFLQQFVIFLGFLSLNSRRQRLRGKLKIQQTMTKESMCVCVSVFSG